MTTPQFGEPENGRAYRNRPAAFGVLERDGRIAVVRVEKPGYAPWLDLPGGAIDPGEDDVTAMAREFGEETGLAAIAGDRIGWADQFFVNTDGEAFNNRQSLFEAQLVAEAPHLKVETDHTLVWIDPQEAIVSLRHDSHAWAVAAWLRHRQVGS
jgi:8-oxo-dGTP diphosphatase